METYIQKATLTLARHYILESWENLKPCSFSVSVLGNAVEICCFLVILFWLSSRDFWWTRVFQLFHCWPKCAAPKCSTFTFSHLSPECNLWHSWSDGWDFSAFSLSSVPSEFNKSFTFRGNGYRARLMLRALEKSHSWCHLSFISLWVRSSPWAY